MDKRNFVLPGRIIKPRATSKMKRRAILMLGYVGLMSFRHILSRHVMSHCDQRGTRDACKGQIDDGK
jgi:hypothetical protein